MSDESSSMAEECAKSGVGAVEPAANTGPGMGGWREEGNTEPQEASGCSRTATTVRSLEASGEPWKTGEMLAANVVGAWCRKMDRKTRKRKEDGQEETR